MTDQIIIQLVDRVVVFLIIMIVFGVCAGAFILPYFMEVWKELKELKGK